MRDILTWQVLDKVDITLKFVYTGAELGCICSSPTTNYPIHEWHMLVTNREANEALRLMCTRMGK
jgi:hypothetical protein